MWNSLSVFRLLFCGAVLLALAPSAAQPAELECSDTALSARGPGFYPSDEQSVEAAKKEWLKKALAIFGDATFEAAKDPKLMCVKQGLYSNCTVSAVPCGSTPPSPREN
jgi:hypothetical protein